MLKKMDDWSKGFIDQMELINKDTLFCQDLVETYGEKMTDLNIKVRGEQHFSTQVNFNRFRAWK